MGVGLREALSLPGFLRSVLMRPRKAIVIDSLSSTVDGAMD